MQQSLAPRRSRFLRLGGFVCVVLAYIIMAGCGDIQVTDATPTNAPPSGNVAPAPNTDVQHDLNILGVDFHPDLNVQTFLAHQPVHLVIGIENRGNRSESNIIVRTALYNGDRSRRLLTDSRTLPSLAAGDVQSIPFTETQTPPRFDSYVLTVDIDAVPNESNLSNNHRTLNISLTGAH